MTLAQIRTQVHQWQRRFARELAVYRLRQLAEEIADDWTIATSEQEELPQPHQVVQRVARQGHLLKTYMNLNQYVQRCIDEERCLEAPQIVRSLLPWAWDHRYDDILCGEIPT